MRQKLLTLYRLLPQHIVAAILGQDIAYTRSHLTSAIPALIARLQQAGRNIQSLKDLSPETILQRGLDRLSVSGAIIEKNGAVRIRDRSLCLYFAAACQFPESKD